MSIPYLARAADQQRLEWIGGGVMSVLLDGPASGGQLTMVRSALPAGSASPVHVHAREDEIFLVLRGSAIFWAGEHRYELTDGGIAFLPRNLPHAYLFTSDHADLLGISTPAGAETFFRAAGWDLSRPRPPGRVLTPEAMAAAAAAADLTILGPPLTADDAAIPARLLRGQATS